MQRIEVIERAAADLAAQHRAAITGTAGVARIERLCADLDLTLEICTGHDVMLGGAYSRLQLWDWEQPHIGGFIWLRSDLDPETRLFAIAHELGHYVLHRGEGINLHAACEQREIDQQADPESLRTEEHVVQEYTPRVRRELEASAFAAELLAPRAEVRRAFLANDTTGAVRLVSHFGISRVLAERRLIDAVLSPTRPRDNSNSTPQNVASDKPDPGKLLARLDESQQLAARASGPALVMAGPGTGKTATLVGRVAHLVQERRVPPEQVLALTFSNRAAGEMRERLEQSGLPGERMPIMTIHAFAATLLREYASRVPHALDEAELTADFRILDEANEYLLMEELLGELPLHYYRSLGNPTAHLRRLLHNFSQARDALHSPTAYRELVDMMRPMPAMPAADEASDTERAGGRASTRKGQRNKPQPPDGTYTVEQIAKARERADAYAVWDRALRRRGLVDFGGLIQRAVELLGANPDVLADVRRRYPEVLVDEFQDTNRASAVLLLLIAGAPGSGLWVVGDHNQSIYRFRGASPGNQQRLVDQYPHLRVLTLRRCYRAVPDIVRLGSAMAARMAELSPATSTVTAAPDKAMRSLQLEAVREDGTHPAIRHAETFASAAHERAGLADAIKRYHTSGYAYGDQAILCRTHKQVRQIASVLASEGVPVSQLGDFFERPEVKDALMLLSLAAGPDARGVLRAAPLLVALGYSPPAGSELVAVAQYLSSQRKALPGALQAPTLSQIPSLAPATHAGLAALGAVATDMHQGGSVGLKLAAFLLRPGGYAWRLARVADGLDAPRSDGPLPGTKHPAHAQQALAALGELVRLAWRFDVRWAQEPDFRARLSRAVTHRKRARPVQPDTLTPAPNADVMPAPLVSSTTSTTSAQMTEIASAVCCFLHYLHALRATDVTIPVPAGDEDAVHALTLHQSKGLEFPVVFLPNLARGQFPATSHGRDEVSPVGFRESDAPGESEAEERCLFYVGVTRARDAVVFTRATSYRASGTTERSALVALLEDAPEWSNAAPLFSDEELAHLLDVAAVYEATGEDEGDEEGDAAPATEREGPAPSSRERPRFSLHDLQQYLECPLQYKYAHRYLLLDPAEDAVYRFHRYIRSGMRELRAFKTTHPESDWKAAEARLRALWEDEGPAGHAYDAFYWRAAEKILREEWQAITSPESAAASERVLLAKPLEAHLRCCTVTLTADRAIEPAGDAAERLAVLVRLHTGRPNDSDKKDLALSLYYLAYQQEHPGASVQIALAYTGQMLANGAADTDTETDTGTPNEPGSWENVTEAARNDAERYRKPERKQRSKLDKLDEAAMGITAGAFAPHPNERRCAACAFCYVCPSDPDGAAFDPARATTGALAPSSE